jgi:hypothetical protein
MINDFLILLMFLNKYLYIEKTRQAIDIGYSNVLRSNAVRDCGACFGKPFMCMIAPLFTDCNSKCYAF